MVQSRSRWLCHCCLTPTTTDGRTSPVSLHFRAPALETWTREKTITISSDALKAPDPLCEQWIHALALPQHTSSSPVFHQKPHKIAIGTPISTDSTRFSALLMEFVVPQFF